MQGPLVACGVKNGRNGNNTYLVIGTRQEPQESRSVRNVDKVAGSELVAGIAIPLRYPPYFGNAWGFRHRWSLSSKH